MPARKTFFSPDYYYHIYNRGSEKRLIFLSDRDYQNFFSRLDKNSKKFSVVILVYCLMPNHFHLLLQQQKGGSIQKFMNAVQLGFAKYFNTKYQRVGPLYQGRFKSKIVESEEYLLQLSAYIHKNPCITIVSNIDMHNQLFSYQYSSYNQYVLKIQGIVNIDTISSYFSKTNPKLSYKSFVEGYIPDIEALYPMLVDQE